ncbi:Guanine nucleotide-binding protein G(t) subunit alpha-2 [Kappamyces sp. JEL0829]|nr:Guanine nucleotide-binding protein G(t) subunit alpha-2 [Kappamyces sp. JEL0829]
MSPNDALTVAEPQERKSSEARAKEIEAYLREEKKKWVDLQSEPKVLLLGSSDSGKSTLLKQLKILHGKGFEARELDMAAKRIQLGMFDAVLHLVDRLVDFESRHIPEVSDTPTYVQQYHDVLENCRLVREVGVDVISPDMTKRLLEAWNEPFVREAWDKGGHRLPDTTPYFFEHHERVFGPDYTPSNQGNVWCIDGVDMLNLRVVTQSVSDTAFYVRQKNLHVIDVSGLSHHRCGWISYFDDVTSIIFVASLSCYDQTMVEEDGVNRMVDSLVLFEDVVNHPLLKGKLFVLFLNKKDLYETKVKTRHIVDYFPQYKGKLGSVSQGIKYFDTKFRDQNKNGNKVVTHVTCCTDTKVMETIINTVVEAIVDCLLNTIGLAKDLAGQTAEDIAKYLAAEKKRWQEYKKDPKLLLLGSSDSGKSTLLKQLKILHGGGFSDAEKLIYKERIIQGMFWAVSHLIALLDDFESLDIAKSYIDLVEHCDAVKERGSLAVTPRSIERLLKAWKEPRIAQVWQTTTHYLPDSTSYYFDEHQRILAPGYTPSNQDILNLRTITQSVSDTVFRIRKKNLHVIDVSGLSHHRTTWMSYFEDVNSILYVAPLSAYDQTMLEEIGVNRMVDSIVLFGDMVNHPLLKNKFFILFLNKKDLYEKKIKNSHIVDYFPQYKGAKGSVSQGIKYFDFKFRDQVKNKHMKENKLSTHITCCTDTKIMHRIISTVLTAITDEALDDVGLT